MFPLYVVMVSICTYVHEGGSIATARLEEREVSNVQE
jgi:hypothetical protein